MCREGQCSRGPVTVHRSILESVVQGCLCSGLNFALQPQLVQPRFVSLRVFVIPVSWSLQRPFPLSLLPVKNLPILLGTAQMSPPSQSCPSFSTNPQSVLVVPVLWALFNKHTVLACKSHASHGAGCCRAYEDGRDLLCGRPGVHKHVPLCTGTFHQ